MFVPAEMWLGFRDGIVKYARSFGEDPGGIGIHREAPPTLMALCFQICLLDLVGELDSQQARQCGEFIAACQAPDGTFVDSNVDVTAIRGFDRDYVTWQTTAFALSALDSAGVQPSQKASYLDRFCERGVLARWLRDLDWSKAWYESNKVMFILNGLQYRRDHSRDGAEAEALTAAIKTGLDVLDDLQDPRTGYWGTDRGSNLFIGMGGAFHILIPYYYERREVRFADRIVTSTLKLQTREGLFRVTGGGACDDLDAIDMLVKLGSSESVSAALTACRYRLLETQRDDGGFSWYVRRPGLQATLSEALDLATVAVKADVGSAYRWARTWGQRRFLYPAGRVFRYSGIDEMPYNPLRSDLWSTWFRAATILLCADGLGEEIPYPVRFKDFPGLTFHRGRSGGDGR